MVKSLTMHLSVFEQKTNRQTDCWN